MGPEQKQRLQDLAACDISDALYDLGVSGGGLLTGVSAFSPLPQQLTTPVVGHAFTVKLVPLDDNTSPRPTAHHVDECPEGYIMLIQSVRSARSSAWGGLMSMAASKKGLSGVVIDGGCRDLAEHRELSFPVFARFNTTLSTKQSMRVSELNVPVTIQPSPANSNDVDSFPEITVRPEDILICDIDGCVVIPHEDLERVIERAEQLKTHSTNIMNELRKGTTVDGANLKWKKK